MRQGASATWARGMDVGGVAILVVADVLVGGPLYVFLVKRTLPVPRDWSGRPRGGTAPTGADPLDGD